MRSAVGLLAAATLAGATACSASDHPAHAGAPAAVAASRRSVETFTPLLQQALAKVKGKTFTSALVAFPPGASALPHRHGQAFVYAYVLEGTVRSKLDDQSVTTYHQGENWVEQPGAHHVLTENASRIKPARLLVVFVADTGAKLKVEDPRS
ncbi:cupin domain-containing protein [Streptomyces sp. NPDC057403]|uniref:cupin domain-containing protein n=1 Tax=Streptomyces sp. NPDC057403 TaxID=3346119 RepID=UPI00369D682E